MGQAKRRGTFEERKAEAIRLKKPSYKKAIGEIIFRKFSGSPFGDIANAPTISKNIKRELRRRSE